MIHRLRWRVGSEQAIEFWAERLAGEGVECDRAGDGRTLAFLDPEGLGLELAVVDSDDEPLAAAATGSRPSMRYSGSTVCAPTAIARPRGADADRWHGVHDDRAGKYVIEGGRRRASYAHDEPPSAAGIQGAGTVHHIAWCDRDAEHETWREHLREIGARPTPIIDRQYFLSIYFREPRGVLFELATPSPGFAVDEDPERLGEGCGSSAA